MALTKLLKEFEEAKEKLDKEFEEHTESHGYVQINGSKGMIDNLDEIKGISGIYYRDGKIFFGARGGIITSASPHSLFTAYNQFYRERISEKRILKRAIRSLNNAYYMIWKED